MTGLLLAMLRERAGLALTTFALTAFAVAAALAGPLYADAAARSALRVEVEAAPVSERVLAADRIIRPGQDGGVSRPPHLAGFDTVTGLLANGNVRTEAGSGLMWLAARSGVCQHLTFAEGRCATADREAVLRHDTAAAFGVAVGDDLGFTASSFGGAPGDTTVRLTVVGIYRTYLPSDPFWADRFMLVGSEGGPIFTNERTIRTAGGAAVRTVDLIASPAAFADRQRLATEVAGALDVLAAAEFSAASDTGVLAKRLDEAETGLLSSMVVATVPLVAICWYVMLLAITGAVRQRRGELAVTALRGVPGGLRWWLPSLETATPILLGTVPGVLGGVLATAAVSAALLPQAPPLRLTPLAVLLAVVSVLGALAAAGFAQWRATRRPVAELLRRVGRRRPSRAARAAEAVAGVLALAAGYQAAAAADTGGIGLLVPLCFGLGFGLLAGRLVAGPAERLGRALLRRGRLTTGLAAISLARRPGWRAMVALLTVAFGLFGFAWTAGDTAERSWAQRARLETGAARVLALMPAPASRLVEVVREIDPEGRFAMAATVIRVPDGPPILAVDTTRLPHVVNWPAADGATVTAAEAAALLRPGEPKPVLIHGARLTVPVTLHSLVANGAARVELRLATPLGEPVIAATERLRPGTAQYTVSTPACAQRPCRLVAMAVSLSAFGRQQLDATIGELRNEHGAPAVTAAALSDLDRWRQREATTARPVATLSAAPHGLRVTADSAVAVDLQWWTRTVAEPVPVISAGDLPPGFEAAASIARVRQAASVPLLPRLGGAGVLADLEHAEAAFLPRVDAQSPEVWLTAAAPADVMERLTAAGFTMHQDIRAEDRHRLFTEQAPAAALGFLRLAALAAILLSAFGLLLAALLDRARRDEDLAILAPQGLSVRTARRGAVLGRGFVLLTAAGAGLAAAAAAWLVARDLVPVYTTEVTAIPLPVWPGPAVAQALTLAVAFLLAAGWLAARVARADIERANR